MRPTRRSTLSCLALSLLGLLATMTAPGMSHGEEGAAKVARSPFRKGDHICIIGNTLADRMQHDGWLETYLQARFPEHDLVIRNLGFSGDELNGPAPLGQLRHPRRVADAAPRPT